MAVTTLFRARAWAGFIRSLAFALGCVTGAGGETPAAARAFGGLHHPVTTGSADAQRAFDDGLFLLYAFAPEEAIVAFQTALRADPHLAMAYWGIAMAAGPNVNMPYDPQRARVGAEAAAVARTFASGASSEERAYIAAVGLRYAATTAEQTGSAQQAYAAAMDALATQYPDDLDAQTLAAESFMDLTPLHMWDRAGRPAPYTLHVIALLRAVLARAPAHPGANHYLIHAYEDSATPEKAIASARRLAQLQLPPAAEHLAHMPEHIYLHTGDYDEANAAGERAVALFRAYRPHERTNAHDGYLRHDLQMLEYGEMFAGNWAKASAAARAAAALVDDTAVEVECYLRFHRDRELLALAPPAVLDVRWHFARALAFARTGDVARSRSELAMLAGNHEAQGTIARDLVLAALAERSGNNDAAVALLRAAVRAQDTLTTAEPPRWFYPVRESLGGRLLVAHRDAEAAAVFEEDLRRTRHNPRSLFGLSQALERRDPARSARVRAEFLASWHAADTRLTVTEL